MNRSFSDRVLGGVCGGMGASLRINAWWLRTAFVLMSIASLGVFAALYLGLWWIFPQESPATRRGGGGLSLLLGIITIVVMVGAWIAHLSGSLSGPDGQALLLPIIGVTLSVILLIRQAGG